MNKTVFIADEIHEIGIKKLEEAEFKVVKKYNLNNESLLESLSNNPAEVLIVRSARNLDGNLIKSLKNKTNVRTICTASSGFDNINITAAKKYNINVLNVPEGNYISAAEHTFALILAISKNLIIFSNQVKNGIFKPDNNNSELKNKTIGIIGVGRVGSRVAKISKAFKMKILGYDINRKLKLQYKWVEFTSLKKLLKESDIISLHVPLTNKTNNMITSKHFDIMRRTTIFINCSRGGVVDEKSLISAISKKKIFYAGLDVFKNEPGINPRFYKLHNVLLTPHVAGKTIESKFRISEHLAFNIINAYN